MELPEIVGDELAAAALGRRAGQTVIADSTTVNFYKSMRAALNLRPGRRRVVLDRDNFPTNRYVVESLARDLDLELVWLQAAAGQRDHRRGRRSRASTNDTAVVTLSHIAYHSAISPTPGRSPRSPTRPGLLVVWDLCHSVGSTEIALDDWDVDFAVGCTYKFVGAGPGRTALMLRQRQAPRAPRPADLGVARPPGFLRDGAGILAGPGSGRCCPARRPCWAFSPSARAPR